MTWEERRAESYGFLEKHQDKVSDEAYKHIKPLVHRGIYDYVPKT